MNPNYRLSKLVMWQARACWVSEIWHAEVDSNVQLHISPGLREWLELCCQVQKLNLCVSRRKLPQHKRSIKLYANINPKWLTHEFPNAAFIGTMVDMLVYISGSLWLVGASAHIVAYLWVVMEDWTVSEQTCKSLELPYTRLLTAIYTMFPIEDHVLEVQEIAYQLTDGTTYWLALAICTWGSMRPQCLKHTSTWLCVWVKKWFSGVCFSCNVGTTLQSRTASLANGRIKFAEEHRSQSYLLLY